MFCYISEHTWFFTKIEHTEYFFVLFNIFIYVLLKIITITLLCNYDVLKNVLFLKVKN